MLIIQIITPELIKTIQIETASHGQTTVEMRACPYCGELVQLPRKFCCDSHKTLYSRYNQAS